MGICSLLARRSLSWPVCVHARMVIWLLECSSVFARGGKKEKERGEWAGDSQRERASASNRPPTRAKMSQRASMHLCIRICARTHACPHTNTHTHTHALVCTHAAFLRCLYDRVSHVCLCVCARACVRACMHACVRACMRACVRACVVCVCVGGLVREQGWGRGRWLAANS